MDTISRESNGTSYLPVAALIVGVLAVVLAAVSLVKISALNEAASGQAAAASRLDAMESQVRQAVTASEDATRRITEVSSRINKVRDDTNTAFGQVGAAISGLREELAKAPGASPRAASTQNDSGKAAAPQAGPGEYIVKSGDTGVQIARANGISWSELQAANEGVNWNRLAVGQKIQLPAR